MVVRWAEFYTWVQPYVPGCPEIVIDQHLQQAAADFCARSEVWRFDIQRSPTVEGISDYEVDVPSGAVLENITHLYLDGQRLIRSEDLYADWPPHTPPSRPHRFDIHLDTQVRFFPTPDDQYEYEGYGVLKPSLSATGIEDFIYETHARSICCGALATLMEIPGKEWSNFDASVYYWAKFAKGADDAKGRDTRRGNMRVRTLRFA